MEYRNKKEIALDIIHRLLDNGMINLEYGQEDFEIGKEECADLIVEQVLSNFTIAEGRLIE